MAYSLSTGRTYARYLLGKIGAPQTPEMVNAFAAWLILESGQNNNPLGVMSQGPNGRYLTPYPTPYAGLDAAARLLSVNAHGYPRVLSEARSGDALGFIAAISASGWNSSKHPNYYDRHLLNKYQSIMGIPITNVGGTSTPGTVPVGKNTIAIPGLPGVDTSLGADIFSGISSSITLVGIILVGVTFVAIAGLVTLRK
jgi:hypothetical protein